MPLITEKTSMSCMHTQMTGERSCHALLRLDRHWYNHKTQELHSCRQLSTEVICNVSLCGHAIMTFSSTKGGAVGPQEVCVLLPPRSIQVLSKEARYSYTHAINMKDVLDPRRVSITFRHSPLTA